MPQKENAKQKIQVPILAMLPCAVESTNTISNGKAILISYEEYIMNRNSETEKQFVQNFITARMRERLLFELNHPQKRIRAIGRFCHTADQLLIPQTIYIKESKLSVPEISRVVSRFVPAKSSCYVLSYDSDLDACDMPLAEALNQCIGLGMPSILILDAKNVVVETEQSFGPSVKYILHIDSPHSPVDF